MTVWEIRDFCKERINDRSLTEQQRKAYENALVSVERQIELMNVKIFFKKGVTMTVIDEDDRK